ncbi:MAG: helix-turn-helix domain-containing protein [Pseudomonadota bacterium]
MNTSDAVARLSALAQETRLAVVRALVKAGPDGMAAGDIAERVSASPTALSFHLKELQAGGLLRSRRRGRFVIYTADIEGLSTLVDFLLNDCCQGRPEICGLATPR